MKTIILGTTSRYKAELFSRLQLAHERHDPMVDETPLPGELAAELAPRLALAKALTTLSHHPDAVAIGADQAASSEVVPIIGKPGSFEANRRLLRQLSGREVTFHTAVAVVSDDSQAVHVDTTTVVYRILDDASIDRYLAVEPAFDCAGGCKVEGLGITLLRAVHSDDPTALIGLPLIALSEMLRAQGIDIPC